MDKTRLHLLQALLSSCCVWMNGPRWPHPELKTEPRERRNKKISSLFFIFIVCSESYTPYVCQRERERERPYLQHKQSKNSWASTSSQQKIRKRKRNFPISNFYSGSQVDNNHVYPQKYHVYPQNLCHWVVTST